MNPEEYSFQCPVAKKCGSCRFAGKTYAESLSEKQKRMEELLGGFAPVRPILGMENPCHYRNKVHHVFGMNRKGDILAGFYQADSHFVVDVAHCSLEDRESQEIIGTVKKLAKSFKLRIYDEDRGTGLLRHVLVRRGFSTGEIMVVLVLANPILPGKNNFVKALRASHPKITTIVLNVNDRDTSMVLGERNIVLYGPGFIKDRLSGCTFRISPNSFYQINPIETEVLYRTAIEFAGLTGKERVVDAYCGIGTIGLSAAKHAKEVIGIELNRDAVKDALLNARENGIENARFYQGDAGEFLQRAAAEGQKADVIFMDPPRSGSTKAFMSAVVKMAPAKVVYVSCGPDTLARDLVFFEAHGYEIKKIQPVDMFPWTEATEVAVQLSKSEGLKRIG